MQKCKVKSIKSIGKQKTYNVTMKGKQHNYKIVSFDERGVYSGNSHAAVYAMLAYQTAWLKIYYPLEFMCNLLTSETSNSDKGIKLDQYTREARRMGITVRDPDINKSGLKYTITEFRDELTKKEKPGIRMPLTIIKGVGEKAVRSIVDNQPFADLRDFIRTVDARRVHSKIFKSLVEEGCMDESWSLSRETLLTQYEEVKAQVVKEKKQKKKKEERLEQYGGSSIFSKFAGSSEKEIKF